MSTPMKSATNGDKRGGFTLVELMVSSAVLISLIYFVTALSQSGSRAQRYAERVNRVTEITQDLVDELRQELTSSVRLFHNDTLGAAYLSRLDYAQAKAPIAFRLPTLNTGGIFEQETVATPRSGNALLFARHAWTATYTVPSSNEYQVDVYRIAHYYLADENGGPQPGRPDGLNLCKWVSEPLVDGDQIDKVTDPTDQRDLLRSLIQQDPDDDGIVHPKVEVVWLRGEDPAVTGTLRHIQNTGTLSNNPQAPRSSPWDFKRDPKWSSNSLLFYRHHSVATNFAPAGYRVGRFSVVSTSGAGFPHGFELQLIGPSAARQLLVRLILCSTNRTGPAAFAEIQAVLDARDI